MYSERVAKTISEQEFLCAGTGKKRVYSWDKWTDGQRWRLILGEDFDVEPSAMVARARDYAYRHDLVVEAKVDGDSVCVWFRNPRLEQLQATAQISAQLINAGAAWYEKKREEGTERVALWLRRKAEEGVRRGDLTRMSSSRDRKLLPAALERCMARGWLVEDADGLLRVGPQSPPQIIKGELA